MVKITNVVSKEDEEKFEQQLLETVSEDFLKRLLRGIQKYNSIRKD